ncbi:hypothetical protein HGRIS_012243 [Hohenbuehelia grisea]|uniref:Uncharacterized protein n=1 Tax=Hohenbuehelia grisea TaxID=104357 RepID=A0ABR3IRN0_9AGAR
MLDSDQDDLGVDVGAEMLYADATTQDTTRQRNENTALGVSPGFEFLTRPILLSAITQIILGRIADISWMRTMGRSNASREAHVQMREPESRDTQPQPLVQVTESHDHQPWPDVMVTQEDVSADHDLAQPVESQPPQLPRLDAMDVQDVNIIDHHIGQPLESRLPVSFPPKEATRGELGQAMTTERTESPVLPALAANIADIAQDLGNHNMVTSGTSSVPAVAPRIHTDEGDNRARPHQEYETDIDMTEQSATSAAISPDKVTDSELKTYATKADIEHLQRNMDAQFACLRRSQRIKDSSSTHSTSSISDNSADNSADEAKRGRRSKTRGPRHRTPAQNKTAEEVRRFTLEMLGCDRDEPLPPPPSEDEIHDFVIRKCDGPDTTFKIDYSKGRSPWNKRAAKVFVRSFITHGGFVTRSLDAIEKAFITHIKALNRRYQLFRHRKIAVNSHPDLLKFSSVVGDLGPNGMSSDEHDDDEEGQRIYAIRQHKWRNPAIIPWIRQLDLAYIGTRHGPLGSLRGNWPRIRKPSIGVDKDHSSPVVGLPLNFYDPVWLNKLHPGEVEDLDIQPSMNLEHTPAFLQYVVY